jgi:hypothetical protein
MNEYQEIYRVWRESGEEDRFLIGWLNSAKVHGFNKTIEGISAYVAYQSLPREERMKYAEYSSYLFDVFFLLPEEKIGFVERNLPPYEYVAGMIWEGKNLTDEEREILIKRISKNPLKAMRLMKNKEEILRRHGLISEEYQAILERQRESEWRDTRKLFVLLYAVLSLEIYLSTGDPVAPLIYLASFPLPYQTLKYISRKVPNKRVRDYVNKLSFLYFVARSPVGAMLSLAEFGIVSPLISKTIGKAWYSDYFPDLIRKAIYETQIRISGIKSRKFNEREMREKLYNIKIDSPNIPKSAIERFKDEVEGGLIEIEDPRKTLLDPWALSWFRRKIVAIQEGSNIRIVDKDYVKRLANKEGTFQTEIEKTIEKYPTRYFGLDYWNDKLVYTRDLIGILSCDIDIALAHKEGYTAILGKKADKIMEGRTPQRRLPSTGEWSIHRLATRRKADGHVAARSLGGGS